MDFEHKSEQSGRDKLQPCKYRWHEDQGMTFYMVAHAYSGHVLTVNKGLVTHGNNAGLSCLRYASVVTLIGLHWLIGHILGCLRNQNMTKCYKR